MEYPGARLTKPIRKTILIAFVAAFFIISPLLLMYSTGYRYDWQTGIFRETGSLSIDALPATAYMYLDGLPLDSSLPVELKNITPKKYHVKISAPGYHTWEKEVVVERKQTTYIKDIRLIKDVASSELLTGEVRDISLSPSGRELIIVRQGKTKAEVVLYDTKINHVTTLLSFAYGTAVSFIWSERHPYVVITAQTTPSPTVLVVNSLRPTEINNLTTGNKKNITRLVWRDTVEPTLYYSTSSSLYMYYPRLREERSFTTNKYRDWFIANDTLWTIGTTSTAVQLISDQLGFHETFATISSTDPGFVATDFRFDTIHQNHVLLNNHNGGMILTNQTNRFSLNTSHALVSPFNDWWLLWNNAELWSYIAGETPYLLHRTGSTLKKVIPVDNYNTLALQFDKEITVLYPYQYIQTTILDKTTNDIAADTTNRYLYYSTDEGLYSLPY